MVSVDSQTLPSTTQLQTRLEIWEEEALGGGGGGGGRLLGHHRRVTNKDWIWRGCVWWHLGLVVR